MSEKIRKKSIEVFLLIAIAILIYPILSTVIYSLPSADDFSMAFMIDRGNVVETSFRQANEFYMTSGGLWPYFFLQGLVNPLVLFGTTSRMLGIELLLFFSIFLLSIYALIRTLFRRILCIDRKVFLLLSYCVILAIILNVQIYKEIFYWFVGSSYMFGVACTFLLATMTIIYMTNGYKKKTAIGVSIVGCLTCTMYQCAVFPGIVYIVLWIWRSKKEKRILWKQVIPFVFMLVGGVISVLAPGNYNRHSVIDNTGLHITDAFVDAFSINCEIIKGLFSKPIFVFGLLICMLIGMYILKDLNYSFKMPCVPYIITAICIYLTCYPLALGYSSAYITNRQYFVLNTYTIIGLVISTGYLGGYIAKKFKINIREKYTWRGVIILSCVLSAMLTVNNEYLELPGIKTVRYADMIKYSSEEWIKIYKEIENSTEQDVVVEVHPDIVAVPVLKMPEITEDETNWVNRAMAKYFDKNTIKISWEYY